MQLSDKSFASRVACGLGALLLLVLVAPAVAAPTELGARILERYDVRDLDEAVRLWPHDAESAIRSIEISDDDEVLVNGKEFDREELSAFLGRDGEMITELLDLDADERRQALDLARSESTESAESADSDDLEAAEPRKDRRESRRRRRGGVDIEVPTGMRGSNIKIRASGDDRVSIGKSVHVAADEFAHDVVCIGCSIDIEGETSGEATAIGGSVHVSGRVGGNATAIAGSLLVRDGGVVEGDGVAVGGSVETSGSGTIEGEETTVGLGGPWMHGWNHDWAFPWGAFDGVGGFVRALMRTGLLALLGVLSVLIAGPAVERLTQRAAGEPWKAVFAGLLMQLLFLPLLVIVVVLLAVSIVGIPLLLLVPFALVAFVIGMFLGFVAVARALGEWAGERFGWSPFSTTIAVIVGVVLIQATSLAGRLLSMPGGVVAMIGFTLVGVGFFLKYLAWTVGLGSMTLVALSGDWRRSRNGSGAVPPPPAPVEREIPEFGMASEAGPDPATDPMIDPPADPNAGRYEGPEPDDPKL